MHAGTMTAAYDRNCRQCPRLAGFLATLREKYPHYHNAPVESFGDPNARLLIVGLAPGMHGANATGRPFTGDHAGILLYRSLYRCGLATKDKSEHADDDLRLIGCRITNAVKCLPPENKPTTTEANTCNTFLSEELSQLNQGTVILALGGIAHRAILRACDLKLSTHGFAHGAEHDLANGLTLIDSYHCSRYNTQTRRLTESMFIDVLKTAAARAATLS